MRCRWLFSNAFVIPAIVTTICLAAAPVNAETLSGLVRDAQGLLVANARVTLLARGGGEQRTTVSGNDGRYSFPGIPAGTYVIEAVAANAALVVSEDVTVSGEQTLDLMLRVAATQSEVLVTAAGTPQTITEVAKAVDIVDAEEMNLRNVFQISEALRVLPGLQVQTLEGPGSLTSIQTRGLRAADTAVLIDGMRFQDSGSLQNDATSFLGDLTTTDTERIEVMRGSGSSLTDQRHGRRHQHRVALRRRPGARRAARGRRRAGIVPRRRRRRRRPQRRSDQLQRHRLAPQHRGWRAGAQPLSKHERAGVGPLRGAAAARHHRPRVGQQRQADEH